MTDLMRVGVWTMRAEGGVPAGVKVAVTDAPPGWSPGLGWEAWPDDGTPVWTPPPVPQRVASVLPVALRRALRATPWPGQPNALAYILLALSAPGYEEPRDAFEFMVRAFRADLIDLGGALGIDAGMADAVLTVAAAMPGADATYENVE